MKRSHLLALLATIPVGFLVCPGAEQKKEDVIVITRTHTYYWQEFTVSKDQPWSDNRFYRLQGVRKNGEVELIDCSVAEIATKPTIVKKNPRKIRDGERPPTIVVVASDFKKQTATIRELRIK